MAYQLEHIIGNSYMLKGTMNLGLYHRGQGKCTLIDSGLDKDAGKRIMNLLKEENMVIDSIINTHAHADHTGGNATIQKNTKADIYATSLEAVIIENPILEPLCLFSATPPAFLRNKFLMAKASKVTKIITPGQLDIKGTSFEIIDLPGHSLEHIGVVTPDGVFYAGDSYLSEKIISKHGFPFLQDIGLTLRTLTYLKDTTYPYNVPCHGDVEENIEKTIKVNIKSIGDSIELLTEQLNEPLSTEELCQRIFERYNIRQNVGQYYLIWSTLSAYLTYLDDQGIIECQFYGQQLKWKRLEK